MNLQSRATSRIKIKSWKKIVNVDEQNCSLSIILCRRKITYYEVLKYCKFTQGKKIFENTMKNYKLYCFRSLVLSKINSIFKTYKYQNMCMEILGILPFSFMQKCHFFIFLFFHFFFVNKHKNNKYNFKYIKLCFTVYVYIYTQFSSNNNYFWYVGNNKTFSTICMKCSTSILTRN